MRLASMPRMPSKLLDIDDDDPRALPISMVMLDAADLYEQTQLEVGLAGVPAENKFFAGAMMLLAQIKGR